MLNARQIKQFGDNVKRLEWERQNRLRIPFEKNLERLLKNYFNNLAQSSVVAFETGEDVYFQNNLDNSFTKLQNIFRIQYNVIARAFKNNALNRTQNVKDFDTEFEIALAQYINGNVATLVTEINETTRQAIKNDILFATQNNLDLPATSNRIRNTLIGFGLWRASLIARTEVHRTASWANEQTAVQMNIAGTIKEWVSVQDDRTRITHSFADGQQRDINDKFEVGGTLLKYPGDPAGGPEETINCRCVVVYTTPDYLTGE